MCPPNINATPSQRWLDTATCVRYFGIKRRDEDEPYIVCINCYACSDLFEEAQGDATYEGVTGHYLHIGSPRNLGNCHLCRAQLYHASPSADCDDCIAEIERYAARAEVRGSRNIDEPVTITIAQHTIATECLNFPYYF